MVAGTLPAATTKLRNKTPVSAHHSPAPSGAVFLRGESGTPSVKISGVFQGSTVNQDIQGGCMCGAVRYSATTTPANSMVCHCQSCRRATAAPVTAWLTFARAEFRFTRGTPVSYESSAKVRRSFCGACGSQLLYEHLDTPDFVDVTTCSLDAPWAFPPTHHSWLSDDIGWVKFGDGLPTFQRSRFGDPS